MKYKGEPVEFDVDFSTIPDFGQGDTSLPGGFSPFQVHITTLQPRWTEEGNDIIFSWKYCFPHKTWCRILGDLDIWLICGRALFCEQKNIPAKGFEVIAMDNDMISDDELGRAVTDTNGEFCIYYRSKDIKRTFLSPLINVETPFSSDFGPDIYFKFAYNGSVFHQEPPSRGKDPDRENVDNCHCVSLCIPETGIPSAEEEEIAGFFHIGLKRRYEIVGHIDSSTGLTTGTTGNDWNDRAFYSTIALVGTLTKQLNGSPMEYKFQVQEYDSPEGAHITEWQDVLPGQLSNSVIGYTQHVVADPLNPVQTTDYAIHNSTGQEPVSFNGRWISIPQDDNLILNNNGLLANLKTTEIVSGSVNMSELKPGDSISSVASAPKNRYFRIRMLKREKGSSTSYTAGTSRPLAIFNTIYKNVPQRGSWMSGTSNELGVACLDLEELSEEGCAGISDSITVKHTAANPNLGEVKLSMKGPGGPYSFDSNNVTESDEEEYGTSEYLGTVSTLPDCAYIIRINAQLKLTNGEENHRDIWDEVAICKK